MSLIGDALRKARQETAERENERKGVLFSARIADAPTRSNLGLGIALGAIIAVVATIAGGAAVWWVLGGAGPQEPSPTQPASASESASVPESVSISGPDDSVSDQGQQQASADSDRRQPPTTSAAAGTVSEPDAIDRGRDARATTEIASIDPEPEPDPVPDAMNPPATTEPETGFVGKEDGADVYLMEADVGDVTLSLDYIVFRETDSYAEINGTEVHVGETVAGFRVKSVERDRVVLSDGRRTIVLRTP